MGVNISSANVLQFMRERPSPNCNPPPRGSWVIRHDSTALLICFQRHSSYLSETCGHDGTARKTNISTRCLCVLHFHKIPVCCGLGTHLGRGWTPAEQEWGAPPSDGRQAGAGWSPHWCIRCSPRARRKWRRRIGAHCEEADRERGTEVSCLESHNLILYF